MVEFLVRNYGKNNLATMGPIKEAKKLQDYVDRLLQLPGMG